MANVQPIPAGQALSDEQRVALAGAIAVLKSPFDRHANHELRIAAGQTLALCRYHLAELDLNCITTCGDVDLSGGDLRGAQLRVIHTRGGGH